MNLLGWWSVIWSVLSIGWLAARGLVGWSKVSQSVGGQVVGRLVSQSVGWLAMSLLGWWSVSWSVGQSISWLVGQLVGWT